MTPDTPIEPPQDASAPTSPAMAAALEIAESGVVRRAFDHAFLSLVAGLPERSIEVGRIVRVLRDKFKREAGFVSDWKAEVQAMRESMADPVQDGERGGALLRFTPTDDGNASRLLEVHGEDMRYVHEWHSWLIWDGCRWKRDKGGQAHEMTVGVMRDFLRQAAVSEGAAKFALKSLNAKPLYSALDLASKRQSIAVEDLDLNPWLLNFRNGTVDLRTGKLRKHDRVDLLTKVIDHAYTPGAKCPAWHGFLDWAMGGGPDASEAAGDRAGRFVAYLQCALGYSVTGATSEKALFIPWGPKGNNGKTTMLEIIRRLIPEYSGMLDVRTLMTKRNGASSNDSADLADLRGVRFVKTSESEEDQTIDQALLKKLTEGQGPMKAIRKYENWQEFTATHKIWFDTNGLPRIKNPDDRATMARLHVIEFPSTLEESEIDKGLPDRIVATESAGILAWLVEGAVRWYRDGQRLNKPAELIAARDRYRDDMEGEDLWLASISEYIEAQELKHFGSGVPLYSCGKILSDAINMPIKDQDDVRHGMKVAKILKKLGFVHDSTPSVPTMKNGEIKVMRVKMYRRG